MVLEVEGVGQIAIDFKEAVEVAEVLLLQASMLYRHQLTLTHEAGAEVVDVAMEEAEGPREVEERRRKCSNLKRRFLTESAIF